jgi:hypothetical protein
MTASRATSRSTTRARRGAVAAVGLLTAVPIAVGFIVSWGALRDAALAAHTARGAARLYPVGVDGLIAVALVAALVLRHNRQASRYCLAVLAAFTASSLVLNIAHGQGLIVPGRPMAWQLGALVSAQAVAAIGFGCHLLVHVLRVWFPALDADDVARRAEGRANVSQARTEGRKAPGGSARHRDAAGMATPSAPDPGAPGSGAAVLHLQRHGAAGATAPDGAAGSKTAAIRHYRARVLAEEGREPTGKETAAATPASERMARKVLAELRGTDPGTGGPVAGNGDAGTTDGNETTDAEAEGLAPAEGVG